MKKFLAIALIAGSLVACNEKKTDETTVTTDTTVTVAPMVDTTATPMMDTASKMMPTDTTAPKM